MDAATPLDALTGDDRQLMALAREASGRAYAPYSGLRVGAALLTASGGIFTGANVENASYGLTCCAERAAVFAAVAAEGTGMRVGRMAVHADAHTASPCGACRQVLMELGEDAVVLFRMGDDIVTLRMPELLPHPFRRTTEALKGLPPRPAERWMAAPITVTARWICWLSWCVSLSRARGIERHTGLLELYVGAWLTLLVAMWYLTPDHSSPVAPGFVIVAFYRLQDLLISTLDDALDLTDRRKASSKSREPHPITRVLLALVNVVQVVLIFAVAYGVFARDGFGMERFSTPLDFLYLSWTSLGPFGGGLTAHSTGARILIIAESASGLLLIAVAISRFLSRPDRNGQAAGKG